MSLVLTVFSILITVAVYLFSRLIASKYPSPFTTPVFLSTTIVIMILVISKISYDEYRVAKDIMTFLLGPATVALAVPLYKHRHILWQNMWPALTGLIIGSVTTAVCAVLLAKVFHLALWIIASLSIKSITVPVASEVSAIIGADKVLVAGIVMITGMLGAMFGPWLMSVCRISHPFARGLSMGTIAHGIGTAEAAREGDIQGAVASVSMGVAAVFTSIMIPMLLPILLR